MTSIIVSIITIAIVTVLVTRPGVAETLRTLFRFLASSIKAVLGTVE